VELLNGKETFFAIREELTEKVNQLKQQGKRAPHLAAILVGGFGPSITYVNAKVKDCERIGFGSSLIELPADVTEDDLLEKVNELNNNPEVDGFIVQLPLPKHINENNIIEAINPNKDVDGFHPVNVGKMVLGLPSFVPATPYGIVEMLDRNNIETEGKHCVVIGRSNIVGTPMSILLSRKANPGNCTVTLVHSRTKDLAFYTKQADILIAAIGKAHFVKADMVKEGVVIVDVGIHRIEDATKKSGYRLIGDVDFDEVSKKCSHISPVPGGVGPMTRAGLLLNTMRAYEAK
jgi:methylenetetrahydrofolate dehydrogenase (NADP+) / methenyltetrahydrofolate cyclohydrolase